MENPKEPTALQAEFMRLWKASGWRFQNRAARELGVSPSSVSRYIDGTMEPSLPVLRLFAERIGVPLTLPGEERKLRALSDGPRWLEEWEEDVILTLRRLPTETRRQIIQGIREIVGAVAPAVTYQSPKPGTTRTEAALTESDQIAMSVVAGLNATGTAPAQPPEPGRATRERKPGDR